MSQEKGILINSEPLYLDNDERSIWQSNHGDMFAWQIEVELNNEIVFGKAFSKRENDYPVKNNTEIIFSTDWDESKGLPYFKGVKDANSKYSQGNGNRNSRSNSNRTSHNRNSGEQSQHSRTEQKPVVKKGLSDSDILYQSQMLALKYLNEVVKEKNFSLNIGTVKELGIKYSNWIKTMENKKIAIKSINLSVETVKINSALEMTETNIKNSKELLEVASIYYMFLDI